MEYDSIFLKRAKVCMVILGIWPLNFSTHWKCVMYRTLNYILQTDYAIFNVSLAIGLKYVLKGDPLEQADAMQYLLLYIFILWKMSLSRTGGIMFLMAKISEKEKIIMNDKDEKIRDLYMNFVQYNFKLYNIIMGIIVFTVSQFGIITYIEVKSFIGGEKEKILNIPQWFPYDVDNYFYISYAYQALSRVLAAAIMAAVDPLLYSLVYFPVAYLKILGHQLLFFQKRCDLNMEAPDKALEHLISEHFDIINYVARLNGSLRWYLLMDFLIRSYHISLALSKILALQKTGYTDLNYLITMTFQVTYLVILFMPMIFLYYHANELRLESMEIGTNVFHNNWYEQSPSNRKRFLIMMIRAEMPLELKIGNLNGISAELIVKFVQASYTYILLDQLGL